tara:strand:+ start:835 stop:1305 length:471 start_codon:yes stop_codon:yes gene_type:complete
MLDISNKEINLSNIAINIALQSNQHYKLGCIIIKNGKIVCKSFNDKRSRIDGRNFVCVHAETNAIHNLLKYEKKYRKLKNYSLFVIRIGRDESGNIIFRNAKPCKYCTETIKKVGLKKIIYSNEEGILEKMKINKLESDYISKGYDRMKCIDIKSY